MTANVLALWSSYKQKPQILSYEPLLLFSASSSDGHRMAVLVEDADATTSTQHIGVCRRSYRLLSRPDGFSYNQRIKANREGKDHGH